MNNRLNNDSIKDSSLTLSPDELTRPEKTHTEFAKKDASIDASIKDTVSNKMQRVPSNPNMTRLLAIIIALSCTTCYLFWHQHYQLTAKIKALESRYMDSQSKVGTLNEQIENKVSLNNQLSSKIQTDLQTLTQEQSTAKTRLNKVDSEIAKLWVIAHQKNKPEISAVKKQTASLADETKAIKAQYTAHTEKLEEHYTAMQNTQKSVENTALDIKTTQNTQQQTLENIKQQLIMTQNLALEVANLEETLQKIDQRKKVAALTKDIQQINNHRKQLNQQIDQLSDALRQLQNPTPEGL